MNDVELFLEVKAQSVGFFVFFLAAYVILFKIFLLPFPPITQISWDIEQFSEKSLKRLP